jgi:hypothetical protein
VSRQRDARREGRERHQSGAAPRRQPRPARDVFRGKVVGLDELEATLNRWYHQGFTDVSWELLDDPRPAEPWQTGASLPRVFAWAWRD